jgi:hypothetical protein
MVVSYNCNHVKFLINILEASKISLFVADLIHVDIRTACMVIEWNKKVTQVSFSESCGEG